MSRIIQFATKYPLGSALVVFMCWEIVSTDSARAMSLRLKLGTHQRIEWVEQVAMA